MCETWIRFFCLGVIWFSFSSQCVWIRGSVVSCLQFCDFAFLFRGQENLRSHDDQINRGDGFCQDSPVLLGCDREIQLLVCIWAFPFSTRYDEKSISTSFRVDSEESDLKSKRQSNESRLCTVLLVTATVWANLEYPHLVNILFTSKVLKKFAHNWFATVLLGCSPKNIYINLIFPSVGTHNHAIPAGGVFC